MINKFSNNADSSQGLDKIILKNMKFYAYHGVLPEERMRGQYFIIDVELYTNLLLAGNSDNLEHTVNYAEVYDDIKNITLHNRFMLIERLAESIAQFILNKYKNVEKTKILVKKPQAPIKGEFDWMGVEIERSRKHLGNS
ncbi:MAG: dihydroneopterin aldolase [Clostridiaceae bacterium]|nr:dihydroneopterin aldolase [Clostridiaceae bacterium]